MNRFILYFVMVPVMAVLSAAVFIYLMEAYHSFVTGRVLEEAPVKILNSLTLEQKAGQMIHAGIRGKEADDAAVREITRNHAGGIILFARNLSTADENRKLTESLQKLSREAGNLPLFISVDQEGGRVIRVTDGTELFPSAMTIGNTLNTAYAYETAVVSGYDLKSQGINLILAPVLDVNNNPQNPVINTRSFGSDPKMVSRMGRAYAAGLRSVHTTGAGKHFPGHGDTHTDSHLALPAISKNLDELEETELLPFREAIADGMEMIMTAHILFPKIDPVYPATLSRTILTGILREKLGFEGLIITDAMEMNAIADHYSPSEAPRLAFRAGADIILLTSTGTVSEKMIRSLVDGFRSGELSVEELDKRVLRQISLKLKKGLITDHPALTAEETALLRKRKERLDAEAERIYREVRQNSSLNREVSRNGTASLYKYYKGFKNLKPERMIVFCISQEICGQAAGHGIASVFSRSPGEAIDRKKIDSIAGKIKKDKVSDPAEMNAGCAVFVELRNQDVNIWNSFVRSLQNQKEKPVCHMIGLHPGNPFLDFRDSEYSHIIVSFSSTPESLKALAERAFEGDVPASRIHRFLNGLPAGKDAAGEDPTMQIIK